MACHFVRSVITDNEPDTQRLPKNLIFFAGALPEKQRRYFLNEYALLAELMFYLYGISVLPDITTLPDGRTGFVSSHLPAFSLAHAGNTVGVMLSGEGKVGLNLEIFHAHSMSSNTQLSTAEKIWTAAQLDPLESALQLWCIRQSMLKMSGQSSSNALDSLSLNPASGRMRSSICPYAQVMSDIEGGLTWACSHTPYIVHLQCWRYEKNIGFSRTLMLSPHTQYDSMHFMKLTSLPPRR